jgi:hypothetical protein
MKKTISNAGNRKCSEKFHNAYPKGMQSQCLYLYLLIHTGIIQVIKKRKGGLYWNVQEKYSNLLSNQYFTEDAQQYLGDNLLLYIRSPKDICKKQNYNYTPELLLHIIKYVT